MLTFFTTPKAFHGHIGTIQRNALKSWIQLDPRPEVLMMGDDPGVLETAQEFNFKHCPLKTPAGQVPLLSDIFQTAYKEASYDYLCFINTDIILLDDFMPAFHKIRQKFTKFLMISSRWNLDIAEILPLESPDERTQLRQKAVQKHDMYPAGGSDYFVFHKSMFHDIPPLLLGRGYWDNWLMYQAKQEQAAVIDVTYDVIAVHQNHDYSHIQGLQAGERDAGLVFKAQQGRQNLQLAGGQKNIYTNYDADYVMMSSNIYSSWNIKFIVRRLKSSIRRLKLRLLSN